MAPSQITVWSGSSLSKNFYQIRPSTLDLVTPPTCYICATVWLKVKHKDWFDKTPKLERLQMIWPMKLRGAFNFFIFSQINLSFRCICFLHDMIYSPPHLIFPNLPFDSLVLIKKITSLLHVIVMLSITCDKLSTTWDFSVSYLKCDCPTQAMGMRWDTWTVCTS